MPIFFLYFVLQNSYIPIFLSKKSLGALTLFVDGLANLGCGGSTTVTAGEWLRKNDQNGTDAHWRPLCCPGGL